MNKRPRAAPGVARSTPVTGLAAQSGRMPLFAPVDERREPACKPGFVEGNHSSRVHVAVDLEQPTRKRAWIGAAVSVARARCFPIWPCSRWGLPCRSCYQDRGALLPHRFTLTGPCGFTRKSLGGLLSVALSVGSRPPGVTWHLIRRSPDFPPPRPKSEQRLPGRLPYLLCPKSPGGALGGHPIDSFCLGSPGNGPGDPYSLAFGRRLRLTLQKRVRLAARSARQLCGNCSRSAG